MNQLSFRNLISSEDIQKEDINLISDLAIKYENSLKTPQILARCAKHILASLFFEPSTRTRFSFEAAMQRLGGRVLSLEQGFSSSLKKGESLSDMGRIMSCYADIIAMRHPDAGSVAEFAKYSNVPVINAGDGPNQHPTQALLDIHMIKYEKQRLNKLKIGFIGDLKHSRTVYSLLDLLKFYADNEIYLIAPSGLELGEAKQSTLEENNVKIINTNNLAEVIEELDILYVTRIQKERFVEKSDLAKFSKSYVICKESLKNAKDDLVIMHPLPRIDEIDEDVDELPQAKYFSQAKRGVYLRMALLDLMLNN
jgi:aspartate carbamoyltransferase catalytic subunit